MNLSITNFLSACLSILMTLSITSTFDADTTVRTAAVGGTDDILNSNWENSMNNLPSTIPFPYTGPPPEICLELLPSEDYNLVIGFYITVADKNLSSYPDIYIEGMYGELPLSSSSTYFNVGPIRESRLVPIISCGNELYQQRVEVTIPLEGRCAESEFWTMAYAAQLVKLAPDSTFVPYEVYNYPALFPDKYFNDVNGPNDPIFTDYKGMCCNYKNIKPGSNPSVSNSLQSYGTDPLLSGRIEKGDDNKDQTTAYPNPFTDEIIVEYMTDENAEVYIELLDHQGKRMQYRQYDHLSAGDHQTQLDTNMLPGGVYVLRILNNNEISNHKIIKI